MRNKAPIFEAKRVELTPPFDYSEWVKKICEQMAEIKFAYRVLLLAWAITVTRETACSRRRSPNSVFPWVEESFIRIASNQRINISVQSPEKVNESNGMAFFCVKSI